MKYSSNSVSLAFAILFCAVVDSVALCSAAETSTLGSDCSDHPVVKNGPQNYLENRAYGGSLAISTANTFSILDGGCYKIRKRSLTQFIVNNNIDGNAPTFVAVQIVRLQKAEQGSFLLPTFTRKGDSWTRDGRPQEAFDNQPILGISIDRFFSIHSVQPFDDTGLKLKDGIYWHATLQQSGVGSSDQPTAWAWPQFEEYANNNHALFSNRIIEFSPSKSGVSFDVGTDQTERMYVRIFLQETQLSKTIELRFN